MPEGDPIRLGSAAPSALVFETGSRVTTSDSGIQTCSVKALCAEGANIFSLLPAAGVPFSAVFGNNYLPSSFLVDYTDTGPEIEYLEGKTARATINFKRQDPTQIGVRKIFTDSVINYSSLLSPFTSAGFAASGEEQEGVFGFPEPVVTVKYNSSTRPSIGAGGLSTLYALPGSTQASGFPDAPVITIPWSQVVAGGNVVQYFNGTEIVVGTLVVDTTFNFVFTFQPNSRGWQLIRVKTDPVAAQSFWDVQEEWRNFYFFLRTQFVSAVPPVPPP